MQIEPPKRSASAAALFTGGYRSMGYHKPVSTSPNPSRQSSTFSHLDPALRSTHIKFEGRVTMLTLAAGFPGVALCALLLWLDGYSSRTQWTVDLLLVFFWLAIAANL